jgi:hypothetical protein
MIIVIPEPIDARKKSWRKSLDRVDLAQSNGYAFVGSWLRAGERAELDEGCLVLGYDEAGSTKNWYPVIRVWRLAPDGLEQVYRYDGRVRERSWALAVRDAVAALLPAAPAASEELQADTKGGPDE